MYKGVHNDNALHTIMNMNITENIILNLKKDFIFLINGTIVYSRVQCPVQWLSMGYSGIQ